MKKNLLVFVIVLLLPIHFANDQIVAVVDAALNTLMTATGVAQAIHYAKMVQETVETATRFQQQIEQWNYNVQRTIHGLQSAKDISSWSDFTDWYNRQLYYEQQTIAAFKNVNISIGKKKYSLYDLEGIVDAVDDTFIQYWDREFTEEQNRQMWLGLGLTPANYAFVQPFREKAREISREFLVAHDLQNEWYARNLIRNNERQEKMEQDKFLDAEDPDKLSEKEILMYMLESGMETNKVINDISMYMAREAQRQATEYYLNQMRHDAPALSEWPEDGFKPLK